MDGTPVERRGGAPSGLERLFTDEPNLTITRYSNQGICSPVRGSPAFVKRVCSVADLSRLFRFLG